MPISGKIKSVYGHWPLKVRDAAATPYIVTPDDFYSILTNSVGAATITLPTPIPAFKGAWLKFACISDSTVVIDCATTDVLIVFNDTEADSISNATASHKTGDSYTLRCDGTKWLVICQPPDEGITRSVVTA